MSGVGNDLQGNNLFVYCFNNPVNRSDTNGNWPQWLVDVGSAVGTFFEKAWFALSESCSISGEIGYGLGLKGKVGTLDVDVTAIVVGDEWTANSDGTTESIRKASITAQAGFDPLSAGLDIGYSVPLAAGKEKGLLGAEGGTFDAVLGVFAGNYGLGLGEGVSQDVELSFGLGAYFVMGGGFEVSFNLTRFIEIWNEQKP